MMCLKVGDASHRWESIRSGRVVDHVIATCAMARHYGNLKMCEKSLLFYVFGPTLLLDAFHHYFEACMVPLATLRRRVVANEPEVVCAGSRFRYLSQNERASVRHCKTLLRLVLHHREFCFFL